MSDQALFEVLADLPGDRLAMLRHNLWSSWFEASTPQEALQVVRVRYLRVAHIAGSSPLDIEVASRISAALRDHEAAALAAVMSFREGHAAGGDPDA